MEEEDEEFGVKEIDIYQALEEMSINEIKFKAGELKSKLPNRKRCVICTLKLPCKHFKYVNEMPKVPEPDLTPIFTTSTFNITEYLPKLSPDRRRSTFKFQSLEFPRQQTTSPNKTRLKQVETLESYRENKLKQEIEKIKAAKEQEIAQKELEKRSELLRKKHIFQQKLKLDQYKLQLAEKNSKIQELLQEELEKKRISDERHKKRLQELKFRINQYHEQKEMLKKISNEKVKELQNDVLTYKPIRIKHLNSI